SEEELLATIAALNADDGIDGLLVQLPLPNHIDENRAVEAIAPGKDVDGIHPINAGRLYLGRPTLVPGTPLGIMRMLDEYEIPLEGARAGGVGPMPFAMELQNDVTAARLRHRAPIATPDD